MARNDKVKLYYDVPNDKPLDSFKILLSGGAVGSVFVFLITSLVGVCNSLSMDVLIFDFFISSIIGFVLGLVLTLVFVKNFSSFFGSLVISESTPTKEVHTDNIDKLASPLVDESEKGQSVDFVFPEFSTDK